MEILKEHVRIYLASDKGNKRGISHFVKYICFWCSKTDRVKKQLLDIDGSGGTSAACAEAVDFSMKKIDDLINRILLHGQITDAGGGGTGKSFKRELEIKNRIVRSLYDEYLSATCGLHGINLTLKNPVKILMGEGGLMGRNALQLLHSAYNL